MTKFHVQTTKTVTQLISIDAESEEEAIKNIESGSIINRCVSNEISATTAYQGEPRGIGESQKISG